MNNTQKIFFTGGIASVLGFILLNPNQLTMIALGAFPTGLMTYFVVDDNAAKRERESAKREKEALNQLSKLDTNYQAALTNLNKAVANESQLKSEVERLKAMLFLAGENSHRASQSIIMLTNSINSLEQQLNSSKTQIEELQAEVEQWELTYKNQVETEASRLLKIAKTKELDKIFSEHDQIASQAMDLFKRLQQWGVKIASGHEAKGEIIKSMATSYNSHLDQVNATVSQEINTYLQQIELLNERVGHLQQELAGELVEPVYGEFGFDTNGKIANALAKEIFRLANIPLTVQGFEVKSDGSVDVGFGYSKSAHPPVIIDALGRVRGDLAANLGIYRITGVRKLALAPIITISYRLDAALKDNDIKLLVGSAEEFTSYVVNHPIRYRLIANPGEGKSPTVAVMVSEILKAGCKRGNTSKGAKVENVLVTVSYPGVESSLKDTDYPLDIFLKYGTETAANKSFADAVEDWKFRKQYIPYAEKFFQIWVWDELDNTLDSASDAQSAENLKKILKQGGHNNIGVIVSGQSVMTKQIKGFTNDDRTLFTEIVIGIPKIRKYLATYGKAINSESNLAKLTKNLDEIEEYVEAKNAKITDDARKLRLALVMDSRSPKLYFLPCLDSVSFDIQTIEQTRKLAENFKRSIGGHDAINQFFNEAGNLENTLVSGQSDSTISPQSSLPHCPHCGSSQMARHSDGRYNCRDCGKRVVAGKVIFK
jgi:predicted RNA-binding Zn-ribbon protein involved in translation (DUF1610 family)